MTGSSQDKVGYKNPPKHTRFGAGNNANPAGKTSETRRLELQNAELAMEIRNRALRAVQAKLNESDTDSAIELLVEQAMLKLLKDSEDRGLGAPVQAITSPDGSVGPTRIVIEAAKPNASDDPASA